MTRIARLLPAAGLVLALGACDWWGDGKAGEAQAEQMQAAQATTTTLVEALCTRAEIRYAETGKYEDCLRREANKAIAKYPEEVRRAALKSVDDKKLGTGYITKLKEKAAYYAEAFTLFHKLSEEDRVIALRSSVWKSEVEAGKASEEHRFL